MFEPDAPPAYAAEDGNVQPEAERGVSDNSGDNPQPAQRRQSSGAGAKKGRLRAPRGAALAGTGKRKKHLSWADGRVYYDQDRAVAAGLDGVSNVATVAFHHNLVFFVPWSTWTPNARNFDAIQPNNRRAEMYWKLIAFFIDLARDLRFWDVYRPENPAEHFRPVLVWETCGEISRSSDHSISVSGFRLRLTCRRFQMDGEQPECDINYKIWTMLTRQLFATERTWWSFNPREWLEMTQLLFQVSMDKRELSCGDVTDPFGVCHPLELFSMTKAVDSAKGLHPATNSAQLDIRSYKQVIGGIERWVFPYPEWTFCFDLERADSERVRNYYFPHLRPRAPDIEVEAELRSHFQGRDPSTISQDEIDRMRTYFTYSGSNTPRNPDVFTPAKLKAKNRERLRQAAELAALDLPPAKERTSEQKEQYKRKYAEQLKQASIAGIRDFMSKIWIPNSLTLPPSVQANVKRWFEHFKKYRNPCLLRQPIHSNLSPIADKFALMLIALHSTKFVESGHVDILRYWLAALHVYLSGDLRINIVTIGVSSNGKSFSLKVVMEMLNVGTWASLLYQSQKAMTGLDKIPEHLVDTITPEEKVGFMKQEKRITFMEEFPASMLGVVQHGSQPGSSDNDSLEKNKRTYSSVTYSVLRMASNGDRIQEEETIQCSDVLLAVTNPLKGTINPYIASRYAIIHQVPKDATGIFNAMLASATPECKRVWSAFVERTQWDQVRVCLVACLIETECLGAVDTSASDAVISAVITEGRTQRLRQLENVRHGQRIRMAAEIICVLEAVDIFFDSELSPLLTREWNSDHLVGIRKYLRTTKEHAVIALGLFRAQYEDPVVPVAENAILHVIRHYTKRDEDEQKAHEDMVAKMERQIGAARKRGLQEQDKLLSEELANAKHWREQRLKGWVWSSAEPSAVAEGRSEGSLRSAHDSYPDVSDNIGDALGAQWPDYGFVYGKHSVEQATLCKIFNRCMNTEKMISRLAHEILNVPAHCAKPGKEDLTGVLRTLLNMMVTVDAYKEVPGGSNQPIGKREVPALTLACREEARVWKYEMSIPEAGVGNRSYGMLQQVIEKVLRHECARHERLLYGVPIPKHPYLFQCIDIYPDPRAGVFKLFPPGYFDKLIRDKSLALVDRMGATARDETPVYRLKEIFPHQVQRYDLDMDIDRFAIGRFELRERLTECELRLQPSHHPFVLGKELWHGRDGGKQYPEDLLPALADATAEDDGASPRKRVMLASELLRNMRRVATGRATEQDEREWGLSSERSRYDEEEEEQKYEDEPDHTGEKESIRIPLSAQPVLALIDNNYGKSFEHVIEEGHYSLDPEDWEPPDDAQLDGLEQLEGEIPSVEQIREESGQAVAARNAIAMVDFSEMQSALSEVQGEDDPPSPLVKRRRKVVHEMDEEKMIEEA
jgi:hypothetical protein